MKISVDRKTILFIPDLVCYNDYIQNCPKGYRIIDKNDLEFLESHFKLNSEKDGLIFVYNKLKYSTKGNGYKYKGNEVRAINRLFMHLKYEKFSGYTNPEILPNTSIHFRSGNLGEESIYLKFSSLYINESII